MIKFFLKRHVFTNLITLLLISLGVYQFVHVRREAFPEISFDWISVTTVFPGASPEEVEKLVVNILEKEIRGVDGVERVLSYSLENRGLVAIRLTEDLSAREKARVINDIQQAVNRAEDLPEEAEEPLVTELTWDRPLITLSVSGGDEFVRDEFAEELADIIEDIPGISRVDQEGDRDKEIWVEADKRKLNQARLTLAEVASAIRRQNVDASAGSVELGREEVWIRIVNARKTADEIKSLIIRGNDERNFLRVADIARVTERFEDARTRTRANGLPSINLMIKKVKSGDTIDLTDEVKKLKSEFDAKAKEKGLTLVLSDDVSFFVKRRLRVMTSNLFQGGFLILVALFVFLDWRLALVAAFGVPISFATAFAVAVPFGFTINLMSLLAFIIVLGMLDDDSVVVAENIYRHMEMGKTPLVAAVEGAKEVVKPVLGAVAVSCCGFLPFAMVSGIMGKILIMIPLIIIIAFVASVFEAFFILPAHVVELMPLGKPVEEQQEGRWYHKVLSIYRETLSWLMHHRAKFFGILILFIGLTVMLAFWRLKFVLFPEGLVDQFFVQVEMPKDTGLSATEKAFQEIEKAILTLPTDEMEAMTGMIGFKMVDESVRYGTHFAQARVFLTPEQDRKRKTRQIVEDLRQKLGRVPGTEKVAFELLQAGPPVGKAVEIRVRGKDLTVVDQIVHDVRKELQSLDGVTDVQDSREGGKDELRVVVNSKEAAFAGVDASRIAQNILFAVDGGEATKVRRATEQLKVKVRLLPEQRSHPEELLDLEVLNERNQGVPLRRIAKLERRSGPSFIEHYNFKPAVLITAEVDTKKITSQEANSAIAKKFKNLPKERPGYELVFGGEAEETAKSMRSLFRAFFLALALDYVILASLFASYIQPFIIILLTVPIGLMGVVYALLLHGQPASFMALLGVVSMTGVVINNAIVLVNFINEKREQGVPIMEAAIQAGSVRLRPIWASSITTLLGLFPTAYGFGGYEPFVAPMALSLAWGLTMAMPMTLFLIPMAYVLTDEMKVKMLGVMQPVKKGFLSMARRILRG